jgi:hypothetical protein
MAALESQVVDTVALAGVDGYVFLGDNWTVERKCAFINLYREHGSIYHAAKLTPVSRQTVYTWIEADEQFAQAVADSKEDSLDDLETSVYQRAFKDSILAMFYLKAHRPKFRDKVTVDLDSLRDEIQQRVAQLGGEQLKQLGTQLPESNESLHFSPPSDDLQKGEQVEPSSQTTTTTKRE